MKTEVVYICEHCGSEYTSIEMCEAHEIKCCRREVAVRVSLLYDADSKFVFTVNKVESRYLPTTQLYEEVDAGDKDCDYFSIISKDTSEKHIKELKNKLVEKAVEDVKKTRDEQNQYYEELLKELASVQERE